MNAPETLAHRNASTAMRFEGIWLPMVTPLQQGRVDLDAARRLARFYRDAGVAGLVLFGSTGEGNLLSLAEKARMIAAVRDDQYAPPVVIGVGGINTRAMAAEVRRLDRLAPAGYLIPPPCYLRPSQAGILWHYRQLSLATRRPIIVYDVPERTGVALEIETLERLSLRPQFAAVKECNPALLAALDRRPDLMPALCGTDAALLDHFLAGGRGAIPTSAHIRPERFVALCNAARAGDADKATALFAPLLPLIDVLFSEPNPAPVKRALAMLGLIRDELRPPLQPAGSAVTRALEPLLRESAEHA